MATPVYNGGWHHRQWGSSGRHWSVAAGRGSMFGGNTPQYLGAGQPAAGGGVFRGSWFGSGSPAYLAAPSTATTPTPSMTPNAATAPQPGQVAIVVPRS